MTDRRAPIRPPHAVWTVTLTVALFLGLLLLLCWQVTAGRDPALGRPPGPPAAAASTERSVLVRRIVRRVVVTRVVEDPAAPGDRVVASAPAASAPVVTRSSAPTRAPAPAPAPAPVVSRSS